MNSPAPNQIDRRSFLKAGAIAAAGLYLDSKLPVQAADRAATAARGRARLTSPVGGYKPQVLMLAPPGGEDQNTLSFLAQLMELGVAVELDANWRLPTRPPKDLSAYRACLFPDHPDIVRQYGRDLDTYIAGGGFVPYTKYFPVQSGTPMEGVHHFYESFGRDAYMYHLANVTLGTTLDAPSADFHATLRARSVDSMVAEYRRGYLAQQQGKEGSWYHWGDNTYTEFVSNFQLAEACGDGVWTAAATHFLDRIVGTIPEFYANRYKIQEQQLPGSVDIHAALVAELLMYYGDRLHRGDWIEAGVKMGRFFMDGNESTWRHDIIYGSNNWQTWSESLLPLPTMMGLARFDGQRGMIDKVDRMMREIAKRNLTEEGLWRHWTDDQGTKGAVWSRGVQWGLLWPTRVLMLSDDRKGSSAQFMVETAKKVYDGLAKHQDHESGVWRLVVDEPATRIESSGTAGIIYCHDRLRSMGLIGGEHDAMIERAVSGMKTVWYRGGLGACCRGTATGIPSYYRTRPLGYYDHSLYPAAFATRLKS